MAEPQHIRDEFDQRLRRVERMVEKIGKMVAALAAGGAPAQAGPKIATDSDLDGAHGDEEIKKDPKRWKGPALAPCKMSACPPDYLDCYADAKEWGAEQDDGKIPALNIKAREAEATAAGAKVESAKDRDDKAAKALADSAVGRASAARIALDKAQKGAKWGRIHAARARGWAKRLRSGWVRPCDGKHEAPTCGARCYLAANDSPPERDVLTGEKKPDLDDDFDTGDDDFDEPGET